MLYGPPCSSTRSADHLRPDGPAGPLGPCPPGRPRTDHGVGRGL